PFGADRLAVFGNSVKQNATIFVQSPVSVKGITFDNSDYRYAIAGDATVTLDDSNNSLAIISVAAGQHEIQTPLSLADNLLISAGAGARLDLNNRVSLNGHHMLVSGG